MEFAPQKASFCKIVVCGVFEMVLWFILWQCFRELLFLFLKVQHTCFILRISRQKGASLLWKFNLKTGKLLIVGKASPFQLMCWDCLCQFIFVKHRIHPHSHILLLKNFFLVDKPFFYLPQSEFPFELSIFLCFSIRKLDWGCWWLTGTLRFI